ncbi:LT_GEWL domain containing protein [uncultured Caudovirales phage]|uniref:LT_GEWL domain containing protein n=1 Tax=uncultured Caudovirales phage TaxID=2100421 RepID=A0A6J5LQX1_9CAUD|nr:LT_GEWL domain containing protein [uncultured Caudovirales phage]
MALPGFISDEEMAALEQGQMPLSRGKVTFEFPGSSAPAQQVEQPAVGFISDEQMAQMESQAGKTVLGELGQGLVEGVTQLPETITALGKGAYNLVRHPIDTLTSDPKATIQTTGRLAGGTSGALLGAAAGVPLAPFTFGLSVPIGAAIGGATGLLAFDKTNQAAGNEAPTDIYQDARSFGANTSTGLALNAAGKAVAAPVKAARGTLSRVSAGADDAANAFAQDALGVKPSAIAKNLERGAIYLDDAGKQVSAANATDFVSKLEQRIGNIQKSDLFKELSNDPAKAYRQLSGSVDELNTAKTGMVQTIDDALTKMQQQWNMRVNLKPDWSYAEKYIKSGKGSAGNKTALAKQLDDLKADWATKNGTFEDLINFKGEVDTGRVFANGPVDAASVKLREAVLKGVKESAEKTADALGKKGAFKAINSDIADRLAVKDFLGKKAARGGGALGRGLQGAANVKSLLLAAGGGASGLGTPVAGMLTVKALADAFPASASRAFSKVSKATGRATNAASKAESATNAVQRLISNPVTVSATQTKRETGRQQRRPQSQQEVPSVSPKVSRESTKTVREPQELSGGFRSLAEALAPAVIKVESGGKNDAVSPKGAAGLMQLMPRTAKNLGVSDRFDPEQNVEGGIKLLAEELARFKSVPLALAAYNAGSPMVMKAIEKAGTTDPIQVMKHLPKETQNYLPKVMKALESMA